MPGAYSRCQTQNLGDGRCQGLPKVHAVVWKHPEGIPGLAEKEREGQEDHQQGREEGKGGLIMTSALAQGAGWLWTHALVCIAATNQSGVTHWYPH